MMEAIRPSSSSKSTALRAVSPPNLFVTPRASRRVAISGVRRLRELSCAAARGQDALRPEDHHQDEDEAEDHPLVLRRLELGGQVGEAVAEDRSARVAKLVDPQRETLEDLEVEHGDDSGAENGARYRAHATQDDHREDADRFHEGERLGIDEDLLGREEHADGSREGGAAGESEELHPHERDSHRLGGGLVLPYRFPRAPDVRVLEPAVDKNRGADDEQHERVEVERVDHVAVGREAEGHERQVVSVEAKDGQAQENARARRDAHAHEQEDEEPPRGEREEIAAEDQVGLRRSEDRPRIRAHREEGDVAQVEEAGEADHDVQPERQRHEDADLDRDLHVVGVDGPEHRHEDAERAHGQRDLEPARHAREVEEEDRALEEHEDHDRAWVAGHAPRGDAEERRDEDRRGHRPVENILDHARSRTTSPRRPLGRKIRIRIRIEKARMSLYSAPKAPPVNSERYEAAKASRMPSTRPPSMAPGILPIPPSTAAVKALSPGMKPVYGLTRLYWTPKRTPAPPPIAPPMRKVSEIIRLTLMPMSEAAAWSSATARMALPILVRLTRVCSPQSMRSEAPMTTRDLTEMSMVGVSSKRSFIASMDGST